MISEFKYLGRS